MSAPSALGWWQAGEERLGQVVDDMADGGLDGASLLPGWQRRTVIGHVARNADGLVNLLHWGRTGEERPMYPSMEAREEGIRATATVAPALLRSDHRASSERLAEAIAAFPDDRWATEVRTWRGRTIPASEVVWMRTKEVWVHQVDLDAGVTFADLPPDLLVAVVDEVIAGWRQRDVLPPVTLTDGERSWGEAPTVIEAQLPDLVGRLTGRAPTPPGWPELPPWM